MRWRRRSRSSTSKRELVQFNQAYAELWRLDPNWLRPGLDERAILDRLRTDGMLPAEADYHAWRAKHLEPPTTSTRRARTTPGTCRTAARST